MATLLHPFRFVPPVVVDPWTKILDLDGSSLTGTTATEGTWDLDAAAIRANGIVAGWQHLRIMDTTFPTANVAVRMEYSLDSNTGGSVYHLGGIITHADATPGGGNAVNSGLWAPSGTFQTINGHHLVSNDVLQAWSGFAGYGAYNTLQWVYRGGVQRWFLNGTMFNNAVGAYGADSPKTSLYLSQYYSVAHYKNIKVFSAASDPGAGVYPLTGW